MIKRTRLLIVLTCLFFSTNILYTSQETQGEPGTQSAFTHRIDSLVTLSKHVSGLERINIYTTLHTILYSYNDAEAHIQLMHRFLNITKTEKDEFGMANAYMFLVDALYNYDYPLNTLQKEALEALDVIRYLDFKNAEIIYFNIADHLLMRYLASKKYEKTLALGKKIYKEAKEKECSYGLAVALKSMGNSYDALKGYDKAIEVHKEVISIKGDEYTSQAQMDSYNFLVDVLIKEDRPNEALEICQKFEAFIKDECTDKLNLDAVTLDRMWFYCHLSYVEVYTYLEQYAKAENYLAHADTCWMRHSAIAAFNLEDSQYELLLAQKKYEEAEKTLNRMESELGDTDRFYKKMRLLFYRADLNYVRGKHQAAADEYRKYAIKNDSINKVEIADELSRLRTEYEVDKLEFQKEQQANNHRMAIMWFLIIFILLSSIIIIIIVGLQKLRVKNRSLIYRIYEQDEQERRYEKMQNLWMENTLIDVSENKKRPEDIHSRLKELMKDPAVFTDPSINRKDIAERLGTNEKYVYDTIKEFYGTNISDYINKLRLNYARALLAIPNDRRTVDAIALESGFNSRSTFYRLFKEHYGMTPIEFRRLIATS